MAGFGYVAKDAKGKTQRGVIEADNPRAARGILRRQGLFPLSIDQHEQRAGKRAVQLRNPLGGSKLALFTRQLATLIDSGMPIDEALTAVAAQTEGNAAKKVVLQIRANVVEGHSLANALAQAPKSFDTLYRSLVKAGESTGLLGNVLEQLAEHLESNLDTQQKLKSALAYPVVLLIISVGIVGFLMTSVVPEIVGVFQRGGQELPVLTQTVIALSDFFVAYGVVVLAATVLAIFGLVRWLNSKAVKQSWHRFLLRVPFVGRLITTVDSTRFASTLSVLVGAGVTLTDALTIARDVMANLELKAATSKVSEKVMSGVSLFRALDDANCFPLLMVHMVGSGERSGELAKMLGRTAQHQQRELNGRLQTAVAILEPLMILVMGGMVLTIVLAVLMPMIEMNNMVNL